MTDTTTIERVRALVLPIASDLHLDVYDLEFRGGTLRVTLDQLSLITRLVGRELDHHDPIPGHYTLEVSSPGLERSLRTPEHFQREIGKTVAFRLRDTAGDARRVQGVLVAATDKDATVQLEEAGPDGTNERTISYSQIDRARTVFMWGPAPKPGARHTSRKES